MTQTYPEDCLQCVVDPWWEDDSQRTMVRGRLIWAFLSHVSQVPYVLTPIGRTSAREHKLADCEIAPLDFNHPPSRANLPVAGLPCASGELFSVSRAKKRPAVVLAEPGQLVPHKLRENQPSYQTSPTYLVAPYYGVDKNGRAGYLPQLVERIRHCEYSQFMWDMLPVAGASESILRLDQLQPLGSRHLGAFEATTYRLSQDALIIMEEWLGWHLSGDLPVPKENVDADEQPLLFDFRESLMSLESTYSE